jgi:hypothetical protein
MEEKESKEMNELKRGSLVHEKLDMLVDDFGYDSLEELLAKGTFDSLSPAICMNVGCNYTTEYEPDQDKGWCGDCNTNTVKSALIIVGII